jgi:hypothetical protein
MEELDDHLIIHTLVIVRPPHRCLPLVIVCPSSLSAPHHCPPLVVVCPLSCPPCCLIVAIIVIITIVIVIAIVVIVINVVLIVVIVRVVLLSSFVVAHLFHWICTCFMSYGTFIHAT